LIDDHVQHLLSSRCSTSFLREHARRLGMRTLREDGTRKLFAGLTSAEEIVATTIAEVD